MKSTRLGSTGKRYSRFVSLGLMGLAWGLLVPTPSFAGKANTSKTRKVAPGGGSKKGSKGDCRQGKTTRRHGAKWCEGKSLATCNMGNVTRQRCGGSCGYGRGSAACKCSDGAQSNTTYCKQGQRYRCDHFGRKIPNPCPRGQSCTGSGQCVSGCFVGANQSVRPNGSSWCMGNSRWTCTNGTAQGRACPQACSNGQCVCQGGAAPGSVWCQQGRRYRCDSSGRTTPNSCPRGQSCTGSGQCVAGCFDGANRPIRPNGSSWCNGSYAWTCTNGTSQGKNCSHGCSNGGCLCQGGAQPNTVYCSQGRRYRCDGSGNRTPQNCPPGQSCTGSGQCAPGCFVGANQPLRPNGSAWCNGDYRWTCVNGSTSGTKCSRGCANGRCR